MTSLHKQKDPAFVLPSYFWPSDELFTGMQRGEKKKSGGLSEKDLRRRETEGLQNVHSILSAC